MRFLFIAHTLLALNDDKSEFSIMCVWFNVLLLCAHQGRLPKTKKTHRSTYLEQHICLDTHRCGFFFSRYVRAYLSWVGCFELAKLLARYNVFLVVFLVRSLMHFYIHLRSISYTRQKQIYKQYGSSLARTDMANNGIEKRRVWRGFTREHTCSGLYNRLRIRAPEDETMQTVYRNSNECL